MLKSNNTNSINGIYNAHFNGAAGNSSGLLLFKDGIISGADGAGGKYDGRYEIAEDNNFIAGAVVFVLPVGQQSVTGATATSEPVTFEVPIKLPTELVHSDVHRIETPAGPINAKFEKLRGL